MAITHYQASCDWYDVRFRNDTNLNVHHRHIADTDAEKPTTGLTIDDYLYAVDTGKLYKAISSTEWEEVIASGNGIVATLSGNTLGTMTIISTGTWNLAGGSNITLSQNGNLVSIVGASGGSGGGNVYAGNYITLSTDGGSTTVSAKDLQATSATSNITSAAFATANSTNLMNTSERGNYFYSSANTFVAAANSSLFQHTSATSNVTSAAFATANSSLLQAVSNSSLSLATGAQVSFAKSWELEGNNTAGTTGSAQGSIWYLSGGNNVTLSGNSNTIVFSAGAGAGDSFFKGWSLAGNTAGTNITALGATASLYLAGGNNVTLSGNSNTISINVAAPGGGGAATVSAFPACEDAGWYNTAVLYTGSSASTGGSTQFTASGRIFSIPMPYQLEFKQLNMLVSAQATSAGTGSATAGIMLGIYTLNQNTVLSLLSSFHWGIRLSQNSISAITGQWWYGANSAANSTGTTLAATNATTAFSGNRVIDLYKANTTLAAGNYYIGVMMTQRTASVNVFGVASMAHFTGANTSNALSFGTSGATAANAFQGIFSTSTNTNVIIGGLYMPGSINTSRITATGGTTQQLEPYFFAFKATT